MADTTQLSDEQLKRRALIEEEFRKRQAQPPAAEFVPPSPTTPDVDVLPPQVPHQEWPDLDATRSRLRAFVGEDATRRYGASDKAFEYLAEQMAPYEVPTAIPAEPTLRESALLAFGPQVIREDLRPPTETDRQKALLHGAVRGVLSPIEIPYRVATGERGSLADEFVPGVQSEVPGAEAIARGSGTDFPRLSSTAAGAVSAPPSKLEPGEERVQGLKAEHETMALLRAVGTLPSAVFIEGVERIPVGLNVRSTIENLSNAESVGDYLTAPDVLQLGEPFGVAPGHNQQVRRDLVETVPTWMGVDLPVVGADYLQGVLERVERGDGLEVDASHAVVNALGDPNIPGTDTKLSDVAWYAGFTVDVFANWEGMLAAGPKFLKGAMAKAGLMAEAGLEAGAMERAVRSVRDSSVDIADGASAQFVQRLESGEASLDDLADAIRPYLYDATAYNDGMTPVELARSEGLRAPELLGDEAFRTETAAARDEASARLARQTNAEAAAARETAKVDAAPQVVQPDPTEAARAEYAAATREGDAVYAEQKTAYKEEVRRLAALQESAAKAEAAAQAAEAEAARLRQVDELLRQADAVRAEAQSADEVRLSQIAELEQRRAVAAAELDAAKKGTNQEEYNAAFEQLARMVGERYTPDNKVRVVEGRPQFTDSLPQRMEQMTAEEWWASLPVERKAELQGLQNRIELVTPEEYRAAWARAYQAHPPVRPAALTVADFDRLPTELRDQLSNVRSAIATGSIDDATARSKILDAMREYRDTGGSTPSKTAVYPAELQRTVRVLLSGTGDPRRLYAQIVEQSGRLPYKARQDLLPAVQRFIWFQDLNLKNTKIAKQAETRLAAVTDAMARLDGARRADAAAVERKLAELQVDVPVNTERPPGGWRPGMAAERAPVVRPTAADIEAAVRRAQAARGDAARLADELVSAKMPERPVRVSSPKEREAAALLGRLERDAETARLEDMSRRARAWSEERQRRTKQDLAEEYQAAFRSLDDLDAPPPDAFVLRNAVGDAPLGPSSTLEEALGRFAERRLEGDELWIGRHRLGVTWRTTADGKAVLAQVGQLSTAERKMVERLSAKLGPVELRSVVGPGERVAGQVLAQAMGLPTSGGFKPTTRTGHAIRDAFRMWATDKLGASETKVLPGTGAVVSPRDYRQIMGKVNGELEQAFGFASADMEDLLTGKMRLTPERLAEINDLAQRWDLPYEVTRVDAATYRDLLRAGVVHHGGVLASARSNLRGAPGMADAVQTWFASFATDKRRSGKLIKAARGTPLAGPLLAGATELLFEDKFVNVPKRVQDVWREAQIRLERDPHQLVKDLQRATALYRESKGLSQLRPVDMAAVVAEVMPSYQPVTKARMDLADEVMTTLRNPTSSEVDGLYQRMMTEVYSRQAPTWAEATTDAGKRAALMRMAEEADLVRQQTAHDWLVAMVLSTNNARSLANTTADATLRTLDPDTLRAVYRELWMDGLVAGPVASKAVALVTNAEVDDAIALGMYILNIRRQSILAETAERLIQESGALLDVSHVQAMRGVNGVDVLNATLLDKHRTWDAARERWTYHYPEGAVAWAERTLMNFGYEPGATFTGEAPRFENMRVGARTVVVPSSLKSHLESVLGAGDIRGSSSTVLNVYDDVLRVWKMSALGGLIFPRMSYFVGQAISLLPTVYTELGAKGTAQLAGTLAENGTMVAELLRRLDTDGTPLFKNRDPNTWMIHTQRGEWYSVADLEEAARRWGLEDTVYDYEVGTQFRGVVGREEPGKLRVLRMAVGTYHDTLRKAGGLADQSMRLGIFVSQVKAGKDLAEAAQIARRAVLDFRALSSVEAKYLRRGYLFYAFMRKNSDQFVRALFRHPSTVTSQMRLAHAASTRDRSRSERGQTRARDLARFRLWFQGGPIVDEAGRLNSQYDGISWVTPPMGIYDQVAGFAGFTDEGSMSPVLAASILAVTGAPEGSQARNRVPPLMVDLLSNGPLASLFAIGPEPLRGEDGILADPDASAILNRPAVWAAGANLLDPDEKARAQANYQAFMMMFNPSTTEQAARAFGVQDPRVGVTQEQELRSYLTGAKPVPHLSEADWQRAGAERMERDMNAAASNVDRP